MKLFRIFTLASPSASVRSPPTRKLPTHPRRRCLPRLRRRPNFLSATPAIRKTPTACARTTRSTMVSSKLGRFQIVLDPNEADAVLELHYEIGIGKSVGSGDGIRQFRVVIEDPRSRIILWSFTERTNYAVFQKNRNKNLDETVATLVSDFNLLAAAQPVAPNNKSKVTHSALVA